MGRRLTTVVDLPVRDVLPTCDAVLGQQASALGGDLPGYRHHVYRVAHLCAAQVGADEAAWARIEAAAVFHDLGIWTHGTFDYLAPSVALARDWLLTQGQMACADEVTAMILEHHKLRPYAGTAGALVEPFRRADWTDVTGGVRHFSVPRPYVRSLYVRWPSAGFHRRLVTLAAGRLRSHPWSPLPMLRF